MATYTVRPGDSLSSIAMRMLGDITRWPEIAALNAITAPYVIYPNQALQLPGQVPAAVVPPPVVATPIYKRPVAWIAAGLLALLAFSG